MFEMRRPGLIATLFLACVPLCRADVTNCKCDPAKPETLETRECALCREADKHPADKKFFFLKDNNPRKPNRWMVLPVQHYAVGHSIDELPRSEFNALWAAAIAKAKELWGEEWGVAYNGEQVRTQCHGHIHIGKLLRGVETGKPTVISNVSQIPLSRGKGIWIHASGTKMHVHWGEQICETVLLR